ncbi:uncharacterized protein LOC118428647 [Branchiostoma floridae]|uniref:Uncharacterized protein LOC118428647 n=1 Tax=Branchiostoma floridae TaxID=7739 RepID=C3YF29_BRAFL|nr:uncharacterized protein LOC118428647 [Branchiostoma floridae]|eukprot:XP_002605021.1 hypothetical protein BRAFLDRAFT_85162 [Branchiostoma floridae]
MSAESTLLTANREELVKNIRFVEPFLDKLLQTNQLTGEECEVVRSGRTPQDRARALIGLVGTKGQEAFGHFRHALKETNPELEDTLHRCAKHNLHLKLYCEECGAMLCRSCRSEDHKDHRCTSLVAEGDALRREFTAFKRENRKILIEHNKEVNSYNVANMRREANKRAEALKEKLCAKIDEERRWFLKQVDDGCHAKGVSSIADSESVAGSEISFSSAAKENKESNDTEDDGACVTDDQTTLCDDLQTAHLEEESLDLLEDVFLPFDDNTRIHIKASKKFPTADFLHSFGGTGTEKGQFIAPMGLTICPRNRIIIADTGNDRVQLFDIDGKWQKAIYVGKHRTAAPRYPTAVACRSFCSPGDVLVTCPLTGELLQFGLNGNTDTRGLARIHVKSCNGVVVLDRGNTVVISEDRHNTIATYTRAKFSSGSVRYVKTKTHNILNGPFCEPRNINTDGLSNVYVSDIGDSTVKLLDKNGDLEGIIGKDILEYPTGVCVDKSGNVIVADAEKNTLEIFASDGHHLDTLIPENEGMKAPWEIALTPDQTKLVVVDGGNHRVVVYRYNQAGDEGVLTNKDIRD